MKITFSTKCVYALRTLLELALRQGLGVIKGQQIASAQAIPLRFLEIILAELRQGGFVESRRGNAGGYVLARPAEKITVAQVIDFIEGHKGARHRTQTSGPRTNDAFAGLWRGLDRTCTEFLESISFAELAANENRRRDMQAPNYAI